MKKTTKQDQTLKSKEMTTAEASISTAGSPSSGTTQVRHRSQVSSELLPIYRSTMSLAAKTVDISARSPRYLKYSLCDRLVGETIDMIELITRANMVRSEERVWALNEFAIVSASFRATFILFQERGVISVKEEAEIIRLLDEIGRQCTGWRNKSKSRITRTTKNIV